MPESVLKKNNKKLIQFTRSLQVLVRWFHVKTAKILVAVSDMSLPISVSVIVVPIFFATDLVGRYTLLLQTGVITKLDG